MLPSGHENTERKSNPIPQPHYFYLSESTFLISFTDQTNNLLEQNQFLNLVTMYLIHRP